MEALELQGLEIHHLESSRVLALTQLQVKAGNLPGATSAADLFSNAIEKAHLHMFAQIQLCFTLI